MLQFIHFSCKKYGKSRVWVNKNMLKSRYFRSMYEFFIRLLLK